VASCCGVDVVVTRPCGYPVACSSRPATSGCDETGIPTRLQAEHSREYTNTDQHLYTPHWTTTPSWLSQHWRPSIVWM